MITADSHLPPLFACKSPDKYEIFILSLPLKYATSQVFNISLKLAARESRQVRQSKSVFYTRC